MRYLVRVQAKQLDQVKSRLSGMGITPVEIVMDYIVIDIPKARVSDVKAIPGVIEVRPEKTVEIMQRYKTAVPVEQKLKEFRKIFLSNPVSGPPRAFAYSLEADKGQEKWTTLESRKMVGADVAEAEGITGKGVKVGVIDTGADPTCAQYPGVTGKSAVEGQPLAWDENGHSCIEGNAMVYTTLCGLETIEDFYNRVKAPEQPSPEGFTKTLPGEVYTIGFNSETTPTRVMAVHKIPFRGKAIRIRAGTAEFVTTPWHPFLVYEPKRNGRNTRRDYRYVRASELAHAHRNYGLAIADRTVPLFSEQTISEETAYLVGLFLAEGTLTHKYGVSFGLHEKEAPIIVDFIKGLGMYASYKVRSGTKGATVMTYKFHKDLRDLGFTVRGQRVIPEQMFKQPPSVIFSMLAGIIDGDGHFDKERERVRIVSTEEKLARQLVNLLSALGFDSRIRDGKQYGKGKKRVWTVSVIGNSFNRLVECISPYLKLKSAPVNGTRHTNPYLLVKEVSEIDYNGYFYDLTTETQNYLAGKRGMSFIHNTWCYTCVAGKDLSTPFGEVKGVAPGAELFISKCLGYGVGTGTNTSVMRAMMDCLQAGCDVVSMSLGSPYSEESPSEIPECRAVEALTKAGLIVVVANGNSGPDERTVGVPANSPYALSIGAIDRNRNLADFSSRGPTATDLTKPDCTAPGVDILSSTSTASMIDNMQAKDGPRLAAISGTSMATPHAAGLCALALEYAKKQGKTLTTEDIKKALAGAATHEKNNEIGYGLITYQKLKSYIGSKT